MSEQTLTASTVRTTVVQGSNLKLNAASEKVKEHQIFSNGPEI